MYLPNGIMFAIHTEQTRNLNVLVHVKVWRSSLVTINSTVNCLVLFWCNREIRQTWRSMRQRKRQICMKSKLVDATFMITYQMHVCIHLHSTV